VVVRGDEAIIADLLASQQLEDSAVETSARYQPAAVAVAEPSASANGYSLKDRVATMVSREEKTLIAEVLNKTNWNRRRAAELLDISYRSLLYKIKEYGLNEIK
jgi:DNA-binding NtrC family response regulator